MHLREQGAFGWFFPLAFPSERERLTAKASRIEALDSVPIRDLLPPRRDRDSSESAVRHGRSRIVARRRRRDVTFMTAWSRSRVPARASTPEFTSVDDHDTPRHRGTETNSNGFLGVLGVLGVSVCCNRASVVTRQLNSGFRRAHQGNYFSSNSTNSMRVVPVFFTALVCPASCQMKSPSYGAMPRSADPGIISARTPPWT